MAKINMDPEQAISYGNQIVQNAATYNTEIKKIYSIVGDSKIATAIKNSKATTAIKNSKVVEAVKNSKAGHAVANFKEGYNEHFKKVGENYKLISSGKGAETGLSTGKQVLTELDQGVHEGLGKASEKTIKDTKSNTYDHVIAALPSGV